MDEQVAFTLSSKSTIFNWERTSSFYHYVSWEKWWESNFDAIANTFLHEKCSIDTKSIRFYDAIIVDDYSEGEADCLPNYYSSGSEPWTIF